MVLYKRVPAAVRSRLDRAILLRPENLATLEAIADQFKLAERYKVSLAALRTYTGKLEQFVRPVLTSQLMAGVLGCLSEEYRQQLVAGSQVLLLSRVIKALTADGEAALSVADLAKLASVLSSFAGRATTARAKTDRARGKRRGNNEDAGAALSAANPTKLAEAVRTLYGLSWPPGDETATGVAEKE